MASSLIPMLNKSDLYAFEQTVALQVDEEAPYGTLNVKYEVRRVDDVRNLKSSLGYRVICTHRVSIPNPLVVSVGAIDYGLFENYPAMLGSSIKVNLPSTALELIDYSPRTLNSAVQTSGGDVLSSTANRSISHSSGSSQSQSNSYGGSVSVGMFGASADANYNHTSSSETNASNTNGSDSGHTSEKSSSAAMSVKDWGGYAQLDTESIRPSWVWAQEYPWDILSWRESDEVGNGSMHLPQWVMDMLWAPDWSYVYPPSQLSQTGIDFTMKASWHIVLPSAVEAQSVTVSHATSYVSATHGIGPSGDGEARLNPTTAAAYTSPGLDLTLLGLDPITHGASPVSTVIGFAPSKFICPPTAISTFKFLAGDNTLQATGTGFGPGMQATCGTTPVTLHLAFKVTDDDFDYSLVLKHWKTTDVGSQLSIIVNGDTTNPIVKFVDSVEGGGGDRNLLQVQLRDLDYTSIDYHDYLVLGLNTVDITITSVSGSTAGYQLRAVAIEQS